MRLFHRSSSMQLQNLKPGELFYGTGDRVVHTLLGSCVAVTIWHPQFKWGGMCHYLLPDREQYQSSNNHPEGHYGSDAINYFIQQIGLRGMKPQSFEVKIFGGGNILQGISHLDYVHNVACANVEHGRRLLLQAGFNLKVEDVGGVRYRNVYFELSSGDVWVQYGQHTKS